ncbi:50S ribosome-binding GTPase [Candidatus Marsarchaeota archaeon]|nr:50S ribosome-binding GTPase [Candidatus Marsarchaeota archaeon]
MAMAKTKDNKATNKALAKLRSKVAQAKKELIEASKRQHGKGFFIKKTGDATASLLGFPSAGKSSLLNVLTNSKSKTAAYAFTTTTIIPGTMIYNGAHIQILDMPGIIEDAHLGKGGGKAVIAQMRVSDLVVFVIDSTNPWQLDSLMEELKELNININKKRPNVQVTEKNDANGVMVEVNKSGIREDAIKEIFNAFGIFKAIVKIWDDLSEDDLIAILSKKAYYMRGIIALNKIDVTRLDKSKISEISSRYKMPVFPVSATTGLGISQLKEGIYQNLGIMRIFLKPKVGGDSEPIIIKKDANVGELASKVHTSILDELKCAFVDGPSVKFRNQRVGIKHILKDGDTVTFIKER